MYGVVVCPRCKRAKGVALKQKTTTCPCGFEIRVVPSRVKARAETARDLAPLVGRINAELMGGLKVVERDSAPRKKRRIREVHARIAAAVPRTIDRTGRIRAAAVGLTKELQLFTLDDWMRVLASLDIRDAEKALQALVASNAVFEPKAGFYRAIDLSP